jgi:hypothetical protein
MSRKHGTGLTFYLHADYIKFYEVGADFVMKLVKAAIDINCPNYVIWTPITCFTILYVH